MAETTGIEWTDATWNVVTGCTKVSLGCDNCYAETFAERWRGIPGHHFESGFDITLRPERLALPFRWLKSKRIFVNSMSDLFHKDIPDGYIAKVFAVMALTPQHTYQVLTKRHARMRSLLTDECRCGNGHAPGVHLRSAMAWAVSKANPDRVIGVNDDAEQRVWEAEWPLPNVHLGVSVENQKWADIRVPSLVGTPAAVRFLSCEPLLGPVDLFPVDHADHERDWDGDWICLDCSTDQQHVPWRTVDHSTLGIDWIIVGGESGHGARPMHPDWARSLRDQCQAAKIPYLFKQWGEWAPSGYLVIRSRPEPGSVLVGDPVDNLGHRVEMRRVGKKRAGRELDGRTWDEFPNPAAAVDTAA